MKLDLENAGIENLFDALHAPVVKLWHFQFGAYGTTHVFVWAGPGYTGIEDALEEAATWLAENAPGVFQDIESDEDEVDMTYTESGWIPSWEWTVSKLKSKDDGYADVWEASIETLADEGELNEDDIATVNATASHLGVDAEWGLSA